MDSKWDSRFMKLAKEIATWSKDESTHVGSVIIGKHKKPLSFGYNGLPRGVNDNVTERQTRPAKYYFFEHAERNAIYNSDSDLEGSTMYVTHFPCAECARAIIQKQISRVVVDSLHGASSSWATRRPETRDSVLAAIEMFNESSITITEL